MEDAPEKCWHYPVDDTDEIIRKTGIFANILAGKELHLEETVPVKAGNKILYDPSIEGKEKSKIMLTISILLYQHKKEIFLES